MKVSSLKPDYTFYTLTHSRSSKALSLPASQKKEGRKINSTFWARAEEPELIITITRGHNCDFQPEIEQYILCPTKKHMPAFKSLHTIIDEDHQFQAWLKLKRYPLNDLPLRELFLLAAAAHWKSWKLRIEKETWNPFFCLEFMASYFNLQLQIALFGWTN